jgi:hypothetical protein
MEDHTSHVINDVLTWAKTFAIDLPLQSTQWAFSTDKEKAITETAWQGYDASVRVLTSTIDTLYRLPLSGVVLDRTANTLLRWQRMSNAVTDAMFSGFWRTVGIPTTAEVRAIEEIISHLVMKIHEQRDAQEILLQLLTQLIHAAKTTEQTNISRSRVGESDADPQHLPRAVTRTTHHKGH